MKINTLAAIQQKGAQRFISLIGLPEKVQIDVNNLFNHGIIQDVPEHYREGADGEITVVTSEYRLAKVAKAMALNTIASKGRGGKQRMKEAVEIKTKKILANLKNLFAAEKCPFIAGEAKVLAIGGHGRAGSWEE